MTRELNLKRRDVRWVGTAWVQAPDGDTCLFAAGCAPPAPCCEVGSPLLTASLPPPAQPPTLPQLYEGAFAHYRKEGEHVLCDRDSSTYSFEMAQSVAGLVEGCSTAFQVRTHH